MIIVTTCFRDKILKNKLVDRKSTRLNSSHSQISYAVFCLKKKKNTSRTCSPIHLTIFSVSSFPHTTLFPVRLFFSHLQPALWATDLTLTPPPRLVWPD